MADWMEDNLNTLFKVGRSLMGIKCVECGIIYAGEEFNGHPCVDSNFNEWRDKEVSQWDVIDMDDLREAFIAGAKTRDEKIKELESQIEKMKCCWNCSNQRQKGGDIGCSEADCNGEENTSKWKMKE
jgi:hypothetical protein